jgi:hypothetical protein
MLLRFRHASENLVQLLTNLSRPLADFGSFVVMSDFPRAVVARKMRVVETVDREPKREIPEPGAKPNGYSSLGGLPAALGVLLGIFSALMLFSGVVALAYVIDHDVIQHLGGVNTGADFGETIVFLLIGLFCGAVALRWTRGRR